MKIKKQRSDLLVLEEFTYVIGIVIALFALALLIQGLVFLSGHDYEKFWGSLLGLLFCFFGLVVYFKKTRFEFDAAKGRLVWSRRGILSKKEGTKSIGDIKNVILMPMRDYLGNLSYVVFLIINGGKRPINSHDTKENQIRVTYSTVSKKEGELIAGLIRKVIGKDGSDLIEDSIRELVSTGRVTEASNLAVKHFKIGINEAMQLINKNKEELKKD